MEQGLGADARSGLTTGETFEKTVEFSPSFYMIKPEPSRNYGVGNVKIKFVLKGPKGAIQFMLGTDWGIKPVREHLEGFGFSRYDDPRQPKGWDIGYHAYEPQYDGQSPMDECDILGCKCYYDGSSLGADEMVEGFLAGGTDWLWPKLEEHYRNRFEDGPYPDHTPTYKPHPDDVA